MPTDYTGRYLVRVSLTGFAYQRGVRQPGCGYAWLDDGSKVYVSEADAKGFDGVIAAVEKLGVDVTEYRQRLAEWVKTGVMSASATPQLPEPTTPPQRWLETCKAFWANHSDGGEARRAALAAENDVAEAAGFVCHPDKRRGHGYCYFAKQEADGCCVEVRSSWQEVAGQRYPWARWVRNDKPDLLYVTLYDKLEDALHDRNRLVYGKPPGEFPSLVTYTKLQPATAKPSRGTPLTENNSCRE